MLSTSRFSELGFIAAERVAIEDRVDVVELNHLYTEEGPYGGGES